MTRYLVIEIHCSGPVRHNLLALGQNDSGLIALAGDGQLLRRVLDLGRRVRQAAGADAGHRQEEERRTSQDGLEGQLLAQEVKLPEVEH